MDGQVIFTSDRELEIGSFVSVEITEAKTYDLIGVCARIVGFDPIVHPDDSYINFRLDAQCGKFETIFLLCQ